MEKQVEKGNNPGVSRREFFKIGGTAAVSVALVALPGCAKPSPEATTPQIPEQTPLDNAENLQTANTNLTDSLNTVRSYAPEVFGGNADDTQRTAIGEFVANLKEAKQQIAAAEAQIAAAEQSGDNAVTYSKEDLATLKQQVTAAEQVIAQFEQEYHTKVIDSQGNWYGDSDHLAELTPKDTLTSDAPAFSAEKPLEVWNYRDKTPASLFKDPNDDNKDYSVNATGIKVSKYVPAKESLAPIDANGFVISLGERELQGAGSPDVKIYALNKKVAPNEFAESTKVLWDPFTNRMAVTNPDWFYALFPESKRQPKQFWGMGYGNQGLNTQVIQRGENLRDVFVRRGNALPDEVLDTANFNTTANYDNYGGALFVGSTLDFDELGSNGTAVTAFEYSNIDNYATVRYPNPNDPNLHDLFDQTAKGYNLMPC